MFANLYITANNFRLPNFTRQTNHHSAILLFPFN